MCENIFFKKAIESKGKRYIGIGRKGLHWLSILVNILIRAVRKLSSN